MHSMVGRKFEQLIHMKTIIIMCRIYITFKISFKPLLIEHYPKTVFITWIMISWCPGRIWIQICEKSSKINSHSLFMPGLEIVLEASIVPWFICCTLYLVNKPCDGMKNLAITCPHEVNLGLIAIWPFLETITNLYDVISRSKKITMKYITQVHARISACSGIHCWNQTEPIDFESSE